MIKISCAIVITKCYTVAIIRNRCWKYIPDHIVAVPAVTGYCHLVVFPVHNAYVFAIKFMHPATAGVTCLFYTTGTYHHWDMSIDIVSYRDLCDLL